MRHGDDMFAGILRELGAPQQVYPRLPARTVVGADDASLVSAANEVAKAAPAAPSSDYLSHLIAAHTSQISDERARRESAERDVLRTKTMVGWGVAGVLGAVLLFILARRK